MDTENWFQLWETKRFQPKNKLAKETQMAKQRDKKVRTVVF
jgi:hypothetical protein